MSHFTFKDFRKIHREVRMGPLSQLTCMGGLPIPSIYLSLRLYFSQFENDAHTMNLENQTKPKVVKFCCIPSPTVNRISL